MKQVCQALPNPIGACCKHLKLPCEGIKLDSTSFPNLKYKPCQNPNARRVFFCFQSIDVLTIEGGQQLVLNIEERNKTIIDCMGIIYQKIYS